MDRTACVDLAAFPLQLLLKRNPRWRQRPVAVVDRDEPQGEILWVNERARSARILPGMRYGAALSLAGELHAAEVAETEITGAVAGLARLLRRHTPRVEAAGAAGADAGPGVFWLDAHGLQRLFSSPRRWAGRIHSHLKRSGFAATVVVGFTRFSTYALARANPGGILVTRDPGSERQAARAVPLGRLALPPASRDLLDRLGITRVGEFIDLPAAGIEKRFNAATLAIHRLAAGSREQPLQAGRILEPARRHLLLEHPAADTGRLMLAIEHLLQQVIEIVAARARTLAEIRIRFRFERLGEHTETVRPAAPTRSVRQLLDLIRLRLQSLDRFPDVVEEIEIEGDEAATSKAQASLFARKPRRDLAAANRALARVRATLGETAVVRARLRDGHLPEGRFTWELLDSLQPPHPRDKADGRLVRRIRARPLPLPPRARQEPDGWMLRGLEQGPVVRVHGPYILSGGWWNRSVHREYHFAEVQRGEILWVYYDRIRRRWFIHGRVE